MVKKIKSYLRREKIDILLAIVVLVVVSLGYLSYLYFVGVPMTRAKNYYNLALLAYEEKNYEKAKNAINNSLRYGQNQETHTLETKIQEALQQVPTTTPTLTPIY